MFLKEHSFNKLRKELYVLKDSFKTNLLREQKLINMFCYDSTWKDALRFAFFTGTGSFS